MQKRMKYFKIILIIFSLVLNSIKFIPTANSQDIISTEIISSNEIEFNSDLSTEFEPSIDPIDNLNKLSEDLQEEKNLHNNADIEDSDLQYAGVLIQNYEVSTEFKANGYPVVNGSSYGEAKFYIIPTFFFPDSQELRIGDYIEFPIPMPFKIDASLSSDIYAGDIPVAKIETVAGERNAKITITHENYFQQLSEQKMIKGSFTVVWDHEKAPINQSITFNLLGSQEWTLTRISVDEELHSHSKWGTQNGSDLTLIDWRIRVNRDINPIGNVTLKDIIPNNQELASPITGLYFSSWDFVNQRGNYFPVTQRNLDSNLVHIDGNTFTINLGDMSDKGILIMYQTRVIGPVDVNKRVYNHLTMSASNLGTFSREDWSSSLRIVDGIGVGQNTPKVQFEVTKELVGKNITDEKFNFILIDKSTNQEIERVRNNEQGKVVFSEIAFSTVGKFEYEIREINDNVTGIQYDSDDTINVEVVVEEVNGRKIATPTYDRNKFINTFVANTSETTIESTSETTSSNTTGTVTESTSETTSSNTTGTVTESTSETTSSNTTGTVTESTSETTRESADSVNQGDEINDLSEINTSVQNSINSVIITTQNKEVNPVISEVNLVDDWILTSQESLMPSEFTKKPYSSINEMVSIVSSETLTQNDNLPKTGEAFKYFLPFISITLLFMGTFLFRRDTLS